MILHSGTLGPAAPKATGAHASPVLNEEYIENMKRRDFLMSGMTAAAAVAGASLAASETAPLRTIAYNLYGCQGFPRKKEIAQRLALAAPQMPTRLAMELTLYGPDVLTFSEAPAQPVVHEVARQLDMDYVYFASEAGTGFPGALLTRFPIIESANCPLKDAASRPDDLLTRHFGRALLHTPSGEIAVFSAHLHPHKTELRQREADLILDVMRADLGAGRPVLLQGDLNHLPSGPEYAKWRDAGLVDAYAAINTDGMGTVSSGRPARRIDYIWIHGTLVPRLIDCRVLYEGAFRLNRDDRAAFALSDHLPIMATFA